MKRFLFLLSLLTVIHPVFAKDVLTSSDEKLYRNIFEVQSKEDWKKADKYIAELKDKSLMGHVLAQRYFSKTWNTKAKEIDGHPEVSGTHPEFTLKAALKLCQNLIDLSKYEVKTFYNHAVGDVVSYTKFLIHKHLFVLGGFRITKSWHNVSKLRNVISRDDKFIGNHAVLICGYNRDNFIIQNSWGRNWGRKGFAYMTNKVFLKQFICGSYLEKMVNNI